MARGWRTRATVRRERLWLLVILASPVVLIVVAGVLADGPDSDVDVPVPATAAREAAVATLDRAANAQGVCYGWWLHDVVAHEVIDRSSNRGLRLPVDGASGCPKWIEVQVDIAYTAPQDEAEDSAVLRLAGSADLADRMPDLSAFERLGLDERAFLDDPGDAILRAALALPLLAAEVGLVDPVPTPSAAPATSPPALAEAGNDYLRGRWTGFGWSAGLLLAGVAAVGFGLWRRGRQRTGPPAAPAASGRPRNARRKQLVKRPTGRRSR